MAMAAAAVMVAVLSVGAWRALGGASQPDESAPVSEPSGLLGAVTARGQTGGDPASPAAASNDTPRPTPVPTTAQTARPAPLTLGTPPAATVEPPPPAEPTRYVVQPGDTLYDISVAHGTTVAELMSFNGLESEFLEIDQVLLIP